MISVQSLSRVRLSVTPWTQHARLPVHHQLLELARAHAQAIISRMDKQQGPAVQHRKLYLVPCDSGKEYEKCTYVYH